MKDADEKTHYPLHFIWLTTECKEYIKTTRGYQGRLIWSRIKPWPWICNIMQKQKARILFLIKGHPSTHCSLEC